MRESKERKVVSVQRGSRLAAAMIVLTCCFAWLIAADQVSAEASIGKIVRGEESWTYTSVSDLADAVEGMEGQTFTIEMERNWNKEAGVTRLVIPAKAHVTLNMNDYMIDRGKRKASDCEDSGEVVYMDSGSSLTVNGGPGEKQHDGWYYTDTSTDGKASEGNFYGGLITGGGSKDGGGGFDMKSETTLTLNRVSVVGCRAQENWRSAYGYGGGIWYKGKSTRITLNNSQIYGCYAYNNGGGIYGDNVDGIRIELNDSHIDHNYCDDNGGGIGVGGEKVTIKGDGKSTVSFNEAGDYGSYDGKGGGIHLNNDSCTVSGLTLEGNKTKNGGGIYTTEETIALNDLTIKDNSADNCGGGIYVENDNTTIHGCEITGNSAGSYGGGVWAVNDTTDAVDEGFLISGKTIVKDNSAKKGNNLTLEKAGTNRAMFDLSRGADVHFGYVTNPDSYCYVTEGKGGDQKKGKNCVRYLTADDTRYHFTFNSAPSYRKIFYVKEGCDNSETGEEDVITAPEAISPAQAGPKAVGRVRGGGEKAADGEYELIRGLIKYGRTYSSTDDGYSAFYYSDGLFYAASAEEQSAYPYLYNDHLAAASLNMAFAGTYLAEGAGNLDSYKYKHAGARQFMSDIGCQDEDIYVNNSNTEKPGTDTIGVTIASKKLQKYGEDGKLSPTGDTLIAVAIRGAGYESEWASNVTLGDGVLRDGEVQGFNEAADQVIGEINYYLARYGLNDDFQDGKVKFWVAGYSRAGATTNLTSKRLVDKIEKAECSSQVFGYPCEAPKGGTDKAEKYDPEAYYCIHNLINDGDIVPLVAPEEMGLKRYGVDHYIPGTAAGEVTSTTKPVDAGRAGPSGITEVTTYKDNEPVKSKTEAFDTAKKGMVKQLDAVDPAVIFDDYFHPMYKNFIPSKTEETGSYGGTTVEDYIKDFIWEFQNGNGYPGWDAVGSRARWATEKTKIGETEYGTIQQAMRDTMSLVFNLSEESSAGFLDRASTIMDSIDMMTFSSDISQRQIYEEVIGAWYKRKPEEKLKYINFFWDLLEDSGAFDYLDPADVAKLKNNWPTLADMIFRFVDFDYNVHPGEKGKAWAAGSSESMMYTPTLMTFAGYIGGNHYPEVNLAWTRAYDSYYDEETTEYDIDVSGYQVEAPAAAAVNSRGVETELESGSDSTNDLKGKQKIRLNSPDINGEAVYYTLVDLDNNQTIAEEKVYRGGIDLESETGTKNYQLTAYSRSYAVNSDPVEYRIGIKDDHHDIKVKYSFYETYEESFRVSEGGTLPITAKTFPENTFVSWTVVNEKGDDVTDLFFGDSEAEPKTTDMTAVLTMPEAGTDSTDPRLSEDYSLVIKANYKGKSGSLIVQDEDAVPQAGKGLADQIPLKLANIDDPVLYPVTWTYTKDDRKILASGDAYQDTAYTATIRVTQDADIQLSPFISEYNVSVASGANLSYFKQEQGDGSVLLRIDYPATGTEGGREAPDTDTAIPLMVRAYDLNIQDKADEDAEELFYVYPADVVTLSAPQVQDETFTSWNLGESGIEFAGPEEVEYKPVVRVKIPSAAGGADLMVDACFRPVIKKVEAEIDAPVSGKPLARTAKAYVEITNDYEIAPDFITVSWSPKGEGRNETAVNRTVYAATVKVTPKTDENGPYIMVREKGTEGDFVRTGAYFNYSDYLQVTMNGEEAVADPGNDQLIYTFPETKYNLTGIQMPENINLPNGSEVSADKGLPKTAKIVVWGGSEMDAPITWIEVSEFTETVEEQSGTAKGRIELPDNVVNADNIDLDFTVNIHVDGAEMAASPAASVGSGDLLADQSVTLSTKTEGGVIHFTTDGSEATADSTVYDGQPIQVKKDAADDDGNFTIRAITVKDGMRNSAEAVYLYTFTNKVPIPEARQLIHNGQEQIGVAASGYYTLEPISKGVTIDENGNAVAAEAGSYQVRAKLTDPENFQWKVEKEDGSVEGTTDDQVISFRIDYKKGTDGTNLGPGASAAGADAAITGMKSDKDPAGSQIAPLLLKSTKQGKHSIKLTWKKPAGAARYVVYGNARGARNKMTKLAEVTGSSYTAKKIKKTLKARTYHKFIVVALDQNDEVVSASKLIFASTKGSKKLANPKAAIVKAKVNAKGKKIKKYKALSRTVLKKGKSLKLKTGIKKARKSKVKKCAAMRFASSNTSIATVSAKGVIKAKTKGKCKIYVYAQNGACKTLTITVK